MFYIQVTIIDVNGNHHSSFLDSVDEQGNLLTTNGIMDQARVFDTEQEAETLITKMRTNDTFAASEKVKFTIIKRISVH